MSEFVHGRDSLLSDGLMTSRISSSLCRVIFESTEVHDATLFMAILQLDLRVLKELGYPGDPATAFRLPQVADSFVIRQSKRFYDRRRSAKQLRKRRQGAKRLRRWRQNARQLRKRGQRLRQIRVHQIWKYQLVGCNRRYRHLIRRYCPHKQTLALSKHQRVHTELVTDPRTTQVPRPIRLPLPKAKAHIRYRPRQNLSHQC